MAFLFTRRCSAVAATRSAGPFVPQRLISDVHITRTGKPIIHQGSGRHSLGGHTATVFGATGFLGRYVVNRLASAGCTVVIPYREEMAKRHLKLSGDLGKVVFVEYDLRNLESVEASVRHSNMVYNLVGRDYPTKNFDLEDVHIDGAARIAEAVAKYDVDRFVHVSSHNADSSSPSEFFRTKGRAEEIVRQIFPETTLVRPSPMFGFEDRLLNRLANITNPFTSNHMRETFWPVHVVDVASALEKMIYDDSTAARTYELFGPVNHSMAELAELVDKEILKTRYYVNVPPQIRKTVLDMLNKYLWWPIGSGAEVEREMINQTIDPAAHTFKHLGIEPATISSLTYQYLREYRSASLYDMPPLTDREQAEEKKYIHVVDDR